MFRAARSLRVHGALLYIPQLFESVAMFIMNTHHSLQVRKSIIGHVEWSRM